MVGNQCCDGRRRPHSCFLLLRGVSKPSCDGMSLYDTTLRSQVSTPVRGINGWSVGCWWATAVGCIDDSRLFTDMGRLIVIKSDR